MNAILDIKDVSFIYHDEDKATMALENISFDVKEKEFVSIVGPSGCGKSTLLSIIAKLNTGYSGSIYLKDKKLECSDTQIGYMLQKDYLLNWRSVYRNILLGLEIQKKNTEENINYVDELLKKYGLYEFRYFKPSQLSGGQKQRAALIRTLSVNPEILLLDEPFSALDYQTRLFVSDEIATIIRNEEKTAILVTHDISEAVSISDRVIVLTKHPGKIKNIHEIDLMTHSPLKARENPEFPNYFNKIWKELEFHEH